MVANTGSRVESYLEWAREELTITAAGEGPSTSTGNGPSPLFFAEVDDVDTTAVLALLAIIPTNMGQDFEVYERRNGNWVEVPQYVRQIQSVDPPALVELDRATLLTVIEQMDAADASSE